MPLPKRSIAMTVASARHVAPRRQQTDSAEGREQVAGERHLLVLAPAVSQDAARPAHHRRRTVVETVERADRQRRQMQVNDQVHRNDACDHL